MNPIVISQQIAKRFILGKQGLWPGRRWKGKKGTALAIRTCEAVQLDPLVIIARSQDIVLHSRVIDYKPEYLYNVAYDERQFFDYGGWLAMYPMSDLPYFRYHMKKRAKDEYVAYFVKEHTKLLDAVRAELRKHGPLADSPAIFVKLDRLLAKEVDAFIGKVPLCGVTGHYLQGLFTLTANDDGGISLFRSGMSFGLFQLIILTLEAEWLARP